MDRRYQGYFDRLIDGKQGLPEFSRSNFDYVLELMGDRPNWRSDAKYFLAYNSMFILFEPVITAGEPGIEPEKVANAFREDVELIDEVAQSIAREREKDYISSTTMAIAMGQVALELRTASFQIWGPNDDEQDR